MPTRRVHLSKYARALREGLLPRLGRTGDPDDSVEQCDVLHLRNGSNQPRHAERALTRGSDAMMVLFVASVWLTITVFLMVLSYYHGFRTGVAWAIIPS